MFRLGLALGLGLTVLAHAGEKELEARVRLLEQRLSSRALVELMQQIDLLQREVKLLQGQLEETLQSNEELQRRVAELENRLRQVETQASAPPAPVSTHETTGSALEAPAAEKAESQQEPIQLPEDPQQAYQKAYDALQAGLYDDAIQAFSAFLKAHPQSEQAVSAWYWLGEAYYVKRDLIGARQAFEKVVTSFPNHPKASDALLKLGYVALDQGDFPTATSALNEVIRKYPGTRAAHLASERLGQMRSAGAEP